MGNQLEYELIEKKARQRQRIRRIITYVFLAFWAVMVLFPFYWMVLTSVNSYSAYNSEYIPKFYTLSPTLQNYIDAFTAVPLARYFLNTLLFTVATTALMMFVIVLAAFAFARLEFRGKNLVFTIVLVVMMIPFEILLLPLYRMLIRAHLTDTYIGVVMPYLVPPFMVFFFRQYVQGLPRELLEAGRIDGCSDYGVFFRIMVPIMIPAFGAMTILSCMNSWNNLLWPLIVLSTNEKFTIPIGMGTTITPYGNAFDVLMPGAVMAVVPIVILYLFAQKTFIAGLTAGSVKG